jgi:hypothetical protein
MAARVGTAARAAVAVVVARLRGRGGGATTGGAVDKTTREDNSATVARWRTNRKETLTVTTLYRLEHRLIRCGGKRTSVQI